MKISEQYIRDNDFSYETLSTILLELLMKDTNFWNSEGELIFGEYDEDTILCDDYGSIVYYGENENGISTSQDITLKCEQSYEQLLYSLAMTNGGVE